MVGARAAVAPLRAARVDAVAVTLGGGAVGEGVGLAATAVGTDLTHEFLNGYVKNILLKEISLKSSICVTFGDP